MTWNVFLQFWEAIIGSSALAVAVGWFLNDGIKQIRKKRRKQAEAKFTDQLRSVRDIYAAMNALRKRDEIDRVFLLEISNCGDKPKPGSVMYAKAVEIAIDRHRFELLERYKRVRLDEAYISMLLKVKASGWYDFEVEHHESCMLKNYYEAEGVKFSRIFHLFTDPEDEKMFIMSVSTKQKNQLFESTGLQSYIFTEVDVIKNTFSKFRT